MNPILELIFYIALAGGLVVTFAYACILLLCWMIKKVYKRVKRKKEVKLNDRQR